MLPDPSTNPAGDSGDPGDGQEPGDYPPPEWPDADLPGIGQPGAVYPDAGPQGLFLSVPAGSFDADRFAQCGPAAEMPPDPLLATIIDAVTGPDGPGAGTLSDDQLIGVIAAVRRLESRVAWYALTAVAQFAARWGGEVAGAEFAADQLACELHLTSRSAAVQLDYATSVAARLPRCLAALYAGSLHPVHLRIIEEETQILSPDDAATADAALAGTAGALTFGKLRSAAHRLVLELDPEAAARQKDAGRRNAYVQTFREPSGNAGMIARELPSDEVLASWQHVEQRALDLRAAGIPGTLEELRVRAYLDLLQERRTCLPLRLAPMGHRPGPETATAAPVAAVLAAVPVDAVPRAARAASGSGGLARRGCRAEPGRAGQHHRAVVRADRPVRHPGRGRRVRHRGRGRRPGPGRRGGPRPPHPVVRYRAAPRRHRRRPRLRTRPPPPARHQHPHRNPRPRPRPRPSPRRHSRTRPRTRRRTRAGPDPPPGSWPRDWISRLRITMTPITRGSCDHHQAETGYRPSRKLRHLVRARNARCTAPGCGRPAARCDVDHTIAWDQGGLTCECDLAPLCRHHHRCKQAEGWRLEQPEPGVMIWRTPAGRVYVTRPSQYPV